MIDTNELYKAAKETVTDDIAGKLRKAADEIADLRGALICIRDGHPDIDNPEDDASWVRSLAADAITRSMPCDPLRNNPVVGFMSEAQAEGILAEMRAERQRR